MMGRLLTIILLLWMVALGSAKAGDTGTLRIVIDDFENGLKPEWKEKSFAGQTEYRVVNDGGGSVLQATSRASASGLVYRINFDPGVYPLLSWRWKVARTIDKGDAHTRAGDDYAARLYVVFPNWLFFRTRSLNYIWANSLPKDAVLPNSYTANAMMIAVESGRERVGEWIVERRNLVDDYRRAFGEDPPQAGAIAIMTDTDNTGEQATAWYDDIVLSRDRGAR